MLEDDGVFCQFDDWRSMFVKWCEEKKKDVGPYRAKPKLLPFLVSGYETVKAKTKPYMHLRLPENMIRGGKSVGEFFQNMPFSSLPCGSWWTMTPSLPEFVTCFHTMVMPWSFPSAAL